MTRPGVWIDSWPAIIAIIVGGLAFLAFVIWLGIRDDLPNTIDARKAGRRMRRYERHRRQQADARRRHQAHSITDHMPPREVIR